MEALEDFTEIKAVDRDSEMKVPIMHVELSFKVRYFLNSSGVGYCSLSIRGVNGKGLRGMIEAAAAKSYIGRTIFVFMSELEDGKKLVTVPALFEKETSFDESVNLSEFIVNTYFSDDFKKTPQEILKEHMDALKGKKTINDSDFLCKSILELPKKGLEILRSSR